MLHEIVWRIADNQLPDDQESASRESLFRNNAKVYITQSSPPEHQHIAMQKHCLSIPYLPFSTANCFCHFWRIGSAKPLPHFRKAVVELSPSPLNTPIRLTNAPPPQPSHTARVNR
jgi:hypothetical protein